MADVFEGKPLPLVYGRARVPGIVIWYGDFKSTESKQQAEISARSSAPFGG